MDFETEVAIIGGGINGAGIAQAAAAAGYRATLIERSDWAAGTSGKSSKLIHGGLRYLETAQLGMVYHSLQEREWLLQNAPTLVHPVRFHIPIYRETRRRPWQIRAGLSLYRLLSRFRRFSDFRSLDSGEWQRLDGLRTDGLQAVFQYWDAQTDDAELTRAVVHSATALGTETLCPAELLSAEQTGDGYRLLLQTANGEVSGRARVLINAAGPWINRVADRIRPPVSKRSLSLIAGAHIVVPGSLEAGIFYMEAPQDGRAVFAMPWRDRTLIGTTETEFDADPDSVAAGEEEQRYLQDAFSHYFPQRSTDVEEAFAGLRVLPHNGSSPFSRSREAFIQCVPVTEPRMIAVYGGKLTTYRHTAEKVARLLQPTLGLRRSQADTRHLPLVRPA